MGSHPIIKGCTMRLYGLLDRTAWTAFHQISRLPLSNLDAYLPLFLVLVFGVVF